MAFFRLLLNGHKVEAGQTNKQLVLLWNSCKGKDQELLPLEDVRPPPTGKSCFGDDPDPQPKRQARPSGPHTSGQGRGRGRIGGHGNGGDAVPPAPAPLPPPAPATPPEPVVHHREDFHGSPMRAEAEDDDADYVTSLFGLKVKYKVYMNPTTGIPEPNWRMKCGQGHPNCSKRRGALAQFERKHSKIEPLAFLHAWNEVAWPSKPTVPSHARETPSASAVKRFAEEHEQELLAVCQLCGR